MIEPTLTAQIEALIQAWRDSADGPIPTDRAIGIEYCADQLAALLPAVQRREDDNYRLSCENADFRLGCDISRGGKLYRQVEVVIGPGKTTQELRAEAAEQRVHELERERAEAVEICALYAQCEFCDESVDPGGNPHHMPVCNTCWNSANEGSGWMQRAIKAEQRVRELETELARVNQEHENLHRYCDTITREHVDMEARALAAEQRIRELEAELSRIRLIVRGMQVGTEVAEAEEIARLKGERP